MYAVFQPVSKKASVFVIDTVRTNQMPNMNALYNAEHKIVSVLLVAVLSFLILYKPSSFPQLFRASSNFEV